jgi:hypothetical protein
MFRLRLLLALMIGYFNLALVKTYIGLKPRKRNQSLKLDMHGPVLKSVLLVVRTAPDDVFVKTTSLAINSQQGKSIALKYGKVSSF